MECPEREAPNPSANNSTATAPTPEVPNYQDAEVPVAHDAKTACHSGTETAETAETASDHGAQIPGDHGAPTDADSGAQAAAQTTVENILEGKEMSKSQNEPPVEVENQFILRLPPEYASTVRKIVRSGSITMKDKLKIDLYPDGRHGVVQVEDVSLTAKLVDLPCVIGSLKTLDKKTFYKTADISQMLMCTADGDGDLHSSPEESVTPTDVKGIGKNDGKKQKKYTWKHGITPPLKNVRKRRFRKTTKKQSDIKQIEEISFTEYIESPDVEKEVKSLLCSDAEAVSARWEVTAEGETKEIESQGSIPGFEFSSGMTGHKWGRFSSEYDVLRELFPDSSSNSDDEEEEEEEEEEKEEEKEEEESEEYENNEEEEEKDDSEDEDEEEEEGEEEEEAEEGKPKDEDEDDSEENLKTWLQAKFTELGRYEAKEAKSSIVMEIQKQIYDTEKTLKQTRGRIKRQEDIIRRVEHSTLKTHLQFVLEQLKLQENQKSEQLISLQKQLKYVLEK